MRVCFLICCLFAVTFSSCSKPEWAHENLMSQQCSTELIELTPRSLHEDTHPRRAILMANRSWGFNDWIPLTQMQFRNESGDIIRFQRAVSVQESSYRKEFEANCEEGQNNSFGINNEIIIDLFYSTDLKLAYSVSTRVDFILKEDEMLFYDDLSVCLVSIEEEPLVDDFQNTLLMNSRGNEDDFDVDLRSNGFGQWESIELLEDDVMARKAVNESGQAVSEFYFSTHNGLEGFIYNEELYELDEMIF